MHAGLGLANDERGEQGHGQRHPSDARYPGGGHDDDRVGEVNRASDGDDERRTKSVRGRCGCSPCDRSAHRLGRNHHVWRMGNPQVDKGHWKSYQWMDDLSRVDSPHQPKCSCVAIHRPDRPPSVDRKSNHKAASMVRHRPGGRGVPGGAYTRPIKAECFERRPQDFDRRHLLRRELRYVQFDYHPRSMSPQCPPCAIVSSLVIVINDCNSVLPIVSRTWELLDGRESRRQGRVSFNFLTEQLGTTVGLERGAGTAGTEGCTIWSERRTQT